MGADVAGPIEGSTFRVAVVTSPRPDDLTDEANKKLEAMQKAYGNLPGIGFRTTLHVTSDLNPDDGTLYLRYTIMIEARYIE
jgi:hypothetical protein